MTTKKSGKTRWSVTTFVLLVALLFSVFSYRQFTSGLILMGVVALAVIVVHAAIRLATRRRSA